MRGSQPPYCSGSKSRRGWPDYMYITHYCIHHVHIQCGSSNINYSMHAHFIQYRVCTPTLTGSVDMILYQVVNMWVLGSLH